MSFGTSSADVDTVVAFCRALSRKCRDAGGDYEEISHEVRGLHTVLKHLKYEVEASDSPINDPQSKSSRQLAPIIADGDETLHELDDLVQEQDHLSKNPNPTRGENDRRGSALDVLGLIRVRILSHKSKLTKFLDSIQLDQGGTSQEAIDNQDGHLDAILDKVDIIAARIQTRNGHSKRFDDDTEAWKQFRRELSEEGFSNRVLEEHKDVLRAYIREIDQKGLLDSVATTSQRTTTSSCGAERWLNVIKSSQAGDRPPSFSSLDLTTQDSNTKAMTTGEENAKFPQSMKTDLYKTDAPRPRRTSNHAPSRPQVPRLITSNEDDDNAIQKFNPNGSITEDLEHLAGQRSNNMQLGEVIRTTELIAYSEALQLYPHSPSSFRSTQSYFEHESPARALPYQPKKALEYSTSPFQGGAIPMPVPNRRTAKPGLSNVPRTSTFHLAPDEHGNEIPHDAKWTKINRRLVSPEVLDQDHRRYEARPEFVAVLGVLSRNEIESLAERSRILRDARHRRSLPVQKPPPAQPPRPIALPSSHSRHRNARDTPSSSSSSSSESDSESSDGRRRRRKNKSKDRERRGYTGSDIEVKPYISSYPNPYGQPIPSPVKSPSFRHESSSSSKNTRTRDGDRERDDSRQRRSHNHKTSTSTSTLNMRGKGERDRDRDRERDRERERDKERDRDKERAYQKSSRWKENLTAAGIGGAAVSLLNVLSEAAEGL